MKYHAQFPSDNLTVFDLRSLLFDDPNTNRRIAINEATKKAKETNSVLKRLEIAGQALKPKDR